MIKLSLPFWMNGPKLDSIRRTAERWWGLVYGWVNTVYNFQDAQTAPLDIVDLLAWQRNIKRFQSEPEWLYRLRVHHALVNARDAGTAIGTQRIFSRLNMPIYELQERLDGYDWDMIGIVIGAADYARDQTLLDALFHLYGRTCRRWLYRVEAPRNHITVAAWSHDAVVSLVLPLSKPTPSTVNRLGLLGTVCAAETVSVYPPAGVHES